MQRTFIGVAIITVLSNGLNLVGVGPYWQLVIKGFVVIGAVLVSQDRTGLFFEPRNADDLARTAKLAWEQPQYMRQLGDNARAEYEAKYTAAANYRQLMEIYREVITHSAAEAGPTSIEELEEVSSV